MENPTETTLKLSSGTEYRVMFTYLGMMRAEEEYDYDVEGVEMDPEKKRGVMRAMLEDVWLGILTFELIPFEDLAMQIQTQEDMTALGETFAHIRKYQAPKEKGGKKKSLSKT